MKELDPLVCLAVVQEMLGWLFWPAVILAALGAFNLIWIVISDRGFARLEFWIALVMGIAGGCAGVWLLLLGTWSSLGDIGGTTDLLLMAGFFAGSAAASAGITYSLLRPIRLGR